MLITGETGTCKELAAHAIHYSSNRRNQRFVSINCGALPEIFLESELSGVECGAFTSAIHAHRGKFEYAAAGTLLEMIAEYETTYLTKCLRQHSGNINLCDAGMQRRCHDVLPQDAGIRTRETQFQEIR